MYTITYTHKGKHHTAHFERYCDATEAALQIWLATGIFVGIEKVDK
jgi:hypothetical protein